MEMEVKALQHQRKLFIHKLAMTETQLQTRTRKPHLPPAPPCPPPVNALLPPAPHPLACIVATGRLVVQGIRLAGLRHLRVQSERQVRDLSEQLAQLQAAQDQAAMASEDAAGRVHTMAVEKHRLVCPLLLATTPLCGSLCVCASLSLRLPAVVLQSTPSRSSC